MDLLKIINTLVFIALLYLLALLAFVKIPETNALAKECQVTILCEHGALRGLLCDRYNVSALPIGISPTIIGTTTTTIRT